MVPFLVLCLAGSVAAMEFSPFIEVSQSGTCLKYSCPAVNVNFPTGTCLQMVNSTVFIQPCTPVDSTICNTTTSMCQKVSPAIVQPSWVGEPCNSSQPCQYGTCQLGSCSGKRNGTLCVVHAECNPGLFCNRSGICVPQLALGAAGCRDEFDCINGADCYGVSGVLGVCTAYASLDIGMSVFDCTGSFSRFCKTGACKTNSTFTKEGECVEAISSVTPLPTLCNSDSDCVGTNGVNYYLSTCVCGYNAAGNSYCAAFQGDAPGTTYTAAWTTALRVSQSICNTMRRYSPVCWQMVGMGEAMVQTTYMYQYYPYLQGNDACIKDTFTREYWGTSGAGKADVFIVALFLMM